MKEDNKKAHLRVVDDENNYLNVFSKNEDEVFAFLFRKYYPALCFFANSILSNEEEAKDIVQDCFVKLWDGQMIKERSETIKSFLYMMTRNRCLDILRKRKVIRKAKFQITKNSETDFEFFDEVAFAEMVRQVIDVIEELPSKIQQIFKMYYIEGKKYREIAKEINSTSEAVRRQKARGLELIRKKFPHMLVYFL